MKISFLNFKGGQGKTSLALNFALTNDFALVTNAFYSPVETALPEERVLKIPKEGDFPDIPDDYDIVYDLGGYVDTRVAPILAASRWVVVPLENEFQALQETISAIEEIKHHNSKIVVVANKLKPGDFENIEHVLRGTGVIKKETPIFPIRHSRAFARVFEEGRSLRDFVAEGGILAHSFKSVSEQFDALNSYLLST